MEQMYETKGKKVFQCEHSELESLKKVKKKAYEVCSKYVNHPVLVETVDGQKMEGIIAHVDSTHVYIMPNQSPYRQYPYSPYPYYNPYPQPYNPYYSTILPLVLFDLLAITLL